MNKMDKRYDNKEKKIFTNFLKYFSNILFSTLYSLTIIIFIRKIKLSIHTLMVK